ncbi:MAG: DUF2065 domain-containing protein [Proteobacteria bacterium]|nr:DUF2065 domain-containing protein [Pseudomonadota bacterium]
MLDFLTAVALILVIEGAVYALFPDAMKRMMAQVLTLPDGSLRWAGLAAAVLGIFLVWVIRG